MSFESILSTALHLNLKASETTARTRLLNQMERSARKVRGV